MTPAALLAGVAIASLAAKVEATAILLARPAATRPLMRNGRRLWWTTKITPVVAAPCLVLSAWLNDDRSGMIIWSALCLFVAIAVPLAIARRHRGSLARQLVTAVGSLR